MAETNQNKIDPKVAELENELEEMLEDFKEEYEALIEAVGDKYKTHIMDYIRASI